MNWQIELLKTLVEMVKQGGTYAIWGIGLWWVFNLLKIVIIGGFIWGSIRLVVLSVVNYHTLRFLSRKDSVSILSKKASQHLLRAVEDYQKQTTTALNDFIKQAKDLQMKSETKTKETVSPKL